MGLARDAKGFWLRVVVRSFRHRLPRLRVTFVAVAFSVAAMVCYAALAAGAGDTMTRNCVRMHAGHVLASWGAGHGEASEQLLASAEAISHAQSAVRRSLCMGLLSSEQTQQRTIVRVYGIEPDRERRHTMVAGRLQEGTYLAETGEILLGRGSVDMLGVQVGDEIRLRYGPDPARTYRVGGVFDTGIYGLDSGLAYVRYGDGPATSFETSILLDRADASQQAAEALRGVLPAGTRVNVWKELRGGLEGALEINRIITGGLIVLVAVILAFGVSSSTYVTVSERRRELAILKAVGVWPAVVAGLILAEVFVLMVAAGALGVAVGAAVVTATGAAGGVDLAWISGEFPMFAESAVVLPRLSVSGMLLPAVVAAAAGTLAAVFPAWRAARVQVIDALVQP